VTTSAAILAAAGCAIAGALPTHGALAALAAIAVMPTVTCCAAMSARRRGRLPQSLLFAAVGGDPSGGGVAITAWLAFWPTLAAIVGSIPVLLVTHSGLGATPVAAGLTLVATIGLAYALDRDPAER
jgi:hypothetical protein